MRGEAQPGHPVSQPPAAHVPVLYTQVLEGLQVTENGTYLDGTFGRGGHARGVLEHLGPGGRLLVMDKDPEAIAVAEQTFGGDARVSIHRGSFAGLGQVVAAATVDGILLDLGVSSPQLDVAGRGFSFGKDGPLDMRMDPDSGQSAADWLAQATDREIADVLWTYGEERQSRRIARAIASLPCSMASSRRSLVNHPRILLRARVLLTNSSQSWLGPASGFFDVKTSTTSPLVSSDSSGTSRPLTLAPIVRWPTSVCTA